MNFSRPPAADDPLWPRASKWLAAGDQRSARLRVVGVPCSVGSITPSQAWRTPMAVRAALARLSPSDGLTGNDLLANLPAGDLGDWPLEDLDLDAAMEACLKNARGLDHREAVHVFLGGDNSITRPLVRGLLGDDLGSVGVLTLDAHHDVRSLDDGPRNGTPIRGLLHDGLPGGNVIQVGIGTWSNSAPYRAWSREHRVAHKTAEQFHRDGAEATMKAALRHLDGCDRIFVDVDMDVLDVAFAPACPGARPGGLTPAQLFAAVRFLAEEERVVAFDIVEVDAATDHDGRTVMVAAMALLEVAAGVASRRNA